MSVQVIAVSENAIRFKHDWGSLEFLVRKVDEDTLHYWTFNPRRPGKDGKPSVVQDSVLHIRRDSTNEISYFLSKPATALNSLLISKTTPNGAVVFDWLTETALIKSKEVMNSKGKWDL